MWAAWFVERRDAKQGGRLALLAGADNKPVQLDAPPPPQLIQPPVSEPRYVDVDASLLVPLEATLSLLHQDVVTLDHRTQGAERESQLLLGGGLALFALSVALFAVS